MAALTAEDIQKMIQDFQQADRDGKFDASAKQHQENVVRYFQELKEKTANGGETYALSAHVEFLSALAVAKVWCTTSTGAKFSGDMGGLLLGGGATAGILCPSFAEKSLYKETKSFSFVGGLFYVGLVFYGENRRPLGHFNGVGGAILGAGGGVGIWEV